MIPLNTYHIGNALSTLSPRQKKSPFGRRHFILLIFFAWVYEWLVPSRWQAITCSTDDLIYWCMNTSLWLGELMANSSIFFRQELHLDVVIFRYHFSYNTMMLKTIIIIIGGRNRVCTHPLYKRYIHQYSLLCISKEYLITQLQFDIGENKFCYIIRNRRILQFLLTISYNAYKLHFYWGILFKHKLLRIEAFAFHFVLLFRLLSVSIIDIPYMLMNSGILFTKANSSPPPFISF